MNDISFSTVQSNGIRMRVAEAGEGPAILFIHGWPESWFSWRHQLTGLAAAGYRVIAPDMRGYGDSDAPAEPGAYSVDILAKDVVGVLDALDLDQATLVGHDWGAMVVWSTALFHPQRFNGVIGMSVPYVPRSDRPPLEIWRETMGDNFFYINYHNEPGGVAEAEYDSDPAAMITALYTSPDTPREDPAIVDPKRSAGGFIGRLGTPKELPGWITQEELDYYINEFSRTGFRGGVNYYRNFDTNWKLSEGVDPVLRIPAAFIAGAADMVIAGANETALRATMEPLMSDLREVTLIDKMGHWVQQEAPTETNAAILRFIESL